MDLAHLTSWREARTRADLVLGDGEHVLAGGTWLYSEPQPHVRGLVDLTTLGWPAWTAHDDGSVEVGATCTLSDLVAAPAEVWGGAAGAVRACTEALLMSPKVWRCATVGGNVALALPAGGLIALTAGLDGVAEVWTAAGGTRHEPVADLVRGVRTTSLAAGEVLRAVRLPAHALAARTVVRRTALTSRGRSASLVVARHDPDGSVTLTLTAATPRPVVLRLPGLPTNAAGTLAAVAAVVDGVVGPDGPGWYDDPHGPPDWRAAVTHLLVREALEALGSPPGGTR